MKRTLEIVRRVADLSLRAKLVAMCSALVLALSGLMLFELPRAIDAQSRGWLVSRSLGLGKLLASAVEAAVDFDDAATAQHVMESIRTSRGVRYALLLRGDGSRMAEWRLPGVTVTSPRGNGELAVMQEKHLDVAIPIATRSGHHATLLLGFGLEELDERRSDARRAVLWSAALFLAGGLTLALLLGTLLARPVLQITEAARRVATGEQPDLALLPIGRRDEIGVLASSFAHMVEEIDAQRAHIRHINADLERRVVDRTQELARTNAALVELEKTQEQLVMADRRVSVGRLAAGVAHEVNNPMAALSANLEYVESELRSVGPALDRPEQAPVLETVTELTGILGECRECARRVTQIVRCLKTFARDDEDKRAVLPLDQPMEAAIGMAMHEVKHRARLVRRYGTVPMVDANEVRLSQVFLNLIINAAHAIPDGDSERHEIRITLDTAPDGRAVAQVADTGCGMTPEVMQRIFEPFFTTKPIGVGSGLGLSISRNIVQKLGGEISVRSEPGRGTTFDLVLPACADAPRPPDAAADAPRRDLSGLRLLVVDDDSEVSRALCRTLAPDVEVVSARGGREALALMAAGQAFHGILCDVMMPEMSGPEFNAALADLDRKAAARTIFMTGGVFTDGTRAFLDGWRGPLLEKPIDPYLLREALHALRS